MINDYKNGGLKMVDIASFTKSLKTAWIKKNTLTILTAENEKIFLNLNLGNMAAN